MNKYYLYLFVMILLTSSGQIFIKKGAIRIDYSNGFLNCVKTFLNKFVVLGTVAVLSAPFFYIYALKKLNLSIAYSFTGLNYVFVFLGSWVILKEKINIYHFIGILVIFAGIIIYNL